MKKTFTKITTLILALVTLFTVFCIPAQAAVSNISNNSSNCVTFVVYTKAKWTECLSGYPAKLTLTQTKGTCVYTDENGNQKTSVNNGYCWYDIDYKVYDNKGKYMFSGHDDFYTANKVVELKASSFKEYKYVVTIKPHYARVLNKYTKDYYMGYVWTKPSVWTAKPTHDITDLWIKSTSKMR
ncbi:MAG: hypothetical protein J5483_01830 [Lachnospiraceae bacterium]|nr:hypothetical protein [Lachnospiraceae bacterium]